MRTQIDTTAVKPDPTRPVRFQRNVRPLLTSLGLVRVRAGRRVR